MKRLVVLVVLAAFLVVVLVGCGPSLEEVRKESEATAQRQQMEQERAMKSWLGHHKNKLIASWGPPTQMMDDGSGGNIYIYTQTVQLSFPGSTSSFHMPIGNMGFAVTQPSAGMAINHSTHKMFWINSQGFVYDWSVK
jgi:hypothetical protein